MQACLWLHDAARSMRDMRTNQWRTPSRISADLKCGWTAGNDWTPGTNSRRKISKLTKKSNNACVKRRHVLRNPVTGDWLTTTTMMITMHKSPLSSFHTAKRDEMKRYRATSHGLSSRLAMWNNLQLSNHKTAPSTAVRLCGRSEPITHYNASYATEINNRWWILKSPKRNYWTITTLHFLWLAGLV